MSSMKSTDSDQEHAHAERDVREDGDAALEAHGHRDVAMSVTRTTIVHCVLTLKSMPILPFAARARTCFFRRRSSAARRP